MEDYVINEFVAIERRSSETDCETIFYQLDEEAVSLMGYVRMIDEPDVLFGFKKDGTFFTHTSDIWHGVYFDRTIMLAWKKSPPEHHLTVSYYLGKKSTTHNWRKEGF